MSTSNPGTLIRNPKLRGEWAELRFMAQAAERGIMVSKPWGDSAPYDFMADHHGRVLRIQVKSTSCRRDYGYKCHVSANGIPYRKDQLDFIATYLIPPDVWYILPIAIVCTQTHLLLSPHSKRSKYDRYKEAWRLLL